MQKKVGLTLLASVALNALSLGGSVSADDEAPFTLQTITAPHSVEDLEAINIVSAGEMAIVARGRDAEKSKFFSFFAVGEQSPVRSVEMPESALYFDFAPVISKDQESLLFLNSSGVQIYDLAADRITPLVEAASIYRQDGSPLFSQEDFARDMNGDGLADILIPSFEGYRLFLNDGEGRFEDAVLLDMQVEMRISGATPRYSQFPAYSFDVNFDGLKDVVFQKDKAFIAFLQRADSGFDQAPKAYEFDIEIVGNSFAAQVESDERYSDQTNLTETFIEAIEDINGDGIMDIVTQTDRAQGLFNRSTRYGFHYGYESNGAIAYNKTADASILLDGVTANTRHIDFAEDGRIDFAGGAVNIGIGKIIGILLSGSVGIPVMFYEQDENGQYSEDPTFRKKISVDFDMSSGQSSVPVVEMTDIDGDGHKDLILSKDDDRIRVYLAEPDGKKMFARKPLELDVQLPKNGEQVKAADLNGDGKGDLMLHYDRLGADGEARKNSFLVLLAK